MSRMKNERNIKPLSRIGGFCFASVSINFFENKTGYEKKRENYNKKWLISPAVKIKMKEFLFGEV